MSFYGLSHDRREAFMAGQALSGLTYDDLQRFPDDHLRRELIDGELFVTAAPVPRHQRVVLRVIDLLYRYERQHGGWVLPGPTDVVFGPRDVVEPDVLFVSAARLDHVGDQHVDAAPDLVVEVSSPSTRSRDLGRKRDLYEREHVGEYWFVDLDGEAVQVRRIGEHGYGSAEIVGRGGRIVSRALPGLTADVDGILG
jgi:Uma2 family endonuclease